ncbi:hypothetical protein L2750_15475 [Shewanella submarina]|uniref:Carrier domain-containing protein n=1 Tax=Shewanella submarina TaxID=2016376 RepID=A0ABV7G8N4_9GAMM|nr:hypothetical protein [Shewanella submarina]MCL1038534.1 hypothetical protein [Shewanella submarina]
MNTEEQKFSELCEWLRLKVKWQDNIPLELDLIENKVVNSLIFVEFLMMLEESTGLEIIIDDTLQPKVASLAAVKTHFFNL